MLHVILVAFFVFVYSDLSILYYIVIVLILFAIGTLMSFRFICVVCIVMFICVVCIVLFVLFCCIYVKFLICHCLCIVCKPMSF